MFCVKCGVQNEEGWNFCACCGARLIDPKTLKTVASAAPSPVMPPMPPDMPEAIEDDIRIYTRASAAPPLAPLSESEPEPVPAEETVPVPEPVLAPAEPEREAAPHRDQTVRPLGANPAQTVETAAVLVRETPRKDAPPLETDSGTAIGWDVPDTDAPPLADELPDHDPEAEDEAFPDDFDADWPDFSEPDDDTYDAALDDELAERPFLSLMTGLVDRARGFFAKQTDRDAPDIFETDEDALFGAELTGKRPVVHRNSPQNRPGKSVPVLKTTKATPVKKPASLYEKQTEVFSYPNKKAKQTEVFSRPDKKGKQTKVSYGKPQHEREQKWFAFDSDDDDFFAGASRPARKKKRNRFWIEHLRTVISLSALALTVIIMVLWMSLTDSGAAFSAKLNLGGLRANRIAALQCENRGDFAGAIRYYSKALSESDEYEDAWALSRAYRAAGELVNEARALQKCVDLDPSRSEAYYRLKELFPYAATRSEKIQQLLNRGAARFQDPTLSESS